MSTETILCLVVAGMVFVMSILSVLAFLVARLSIRVDALETRAIEKFLEEHDK
jgi:Na+-transporting methylmalonyl-CoA/oxaloacetate decarboxylase gamma subunit